jgi:outer membrane protein assembly factor BamA
LMLQCRNLSAESPIWRFGAFRTRMKQFLLIFAVIISTFLAGSGNAIAKTADALSPDVKWKVGSLAFKGNKALSAAELGKTMQTKSRASYLFWQKHPDFNPDTFKTDIERLKRLYASQGYYHARIDYALKTDGHLVDAAITIQEGPQVKVIRVAVRVADRRTPADWSPVFR